MSGDADLVLPPGAPAPASVQAAARAALEAHLGPPPGCGSRGCSVSAGVASGPGEWTFEIAYGVDPDHFSQYDKSTSYRGVGVFREDPPASGRLRVVSGVLEAQDNGTNYFRRPGERVPLLELGSGKGAK